MKRIQYTDDYISEANIDSNINALWGAIFPILEHRKYLYNRYARIQNQDMEDEVQVALEYYISSIASGYFGGKEPQYNVRKLNETQKNIVKKVFDKEYGDKNKPEEFQTLIDFITKYNDNASFFYDCVKDYINTGACYGLIYENSDNEVVYAYTSSLNSVAIWNYETPSQKIGLVRYWIENTNSGIVRHVEVRTKDYIKEYIDGVPIQNITDKADFKFKEKKESYWNDVPIFAVENIDGLSLYENVISLIKKFEQVIKNNANTFQYNDDAKLQVTGFTPQNDILIESRDKDGNIQLDNDGQPIMIKNPARVQEDALLLNSQIFYTPDGSGHIEWILKNINDSASENHKKTLLDLTLMISGVPNVTDVGFTNADNASALEKKFFPLDQVLQQADHEFKKEFLRMWEIITNRINVKKNTNFDFRDIDVILVRNIPSNNTEVVNDWLKLRGLVADSTIIDNLPYDLDAESEQVKIDEQDEKAIQKNIENMQKMQGMQNTTQQENPENQEAGGMNGLELSRQENARA